VKKLSRYLLLLSRHGHTGFGDGLANSLKAKFKAIARFIVCFYVILQLGLLGLTGIPKIGMIDICEIDCQFEELKINFRIQAIFSANRADLDLYRNSLPALCSLAFSPPLFRIMQRTLSTMLPVEKTE